MNKQALLWSFIFMVLLLLCFSPLIMAALSLVMVPVVYLYVKLDSKRFVLYYAGALLAVYALTSPFFGGSLGTVAVLVSLFFLVPSIVIGTFYRRKASARTVLTGGTIAFLAQSLFILLLLTLFGVEVTDQIRVFMHESLTNSTVPIEIREMIPEQLVDQVIDMMVQLLPLYLIGISLYFTVITHWLARKALVKSGESLPALQPAKEWMLPKSFVWYYLIAVVLGFFFTKPDGSLISMVLLNVMPLLRLAFIVQAIGFFFYLASVKGWPRRRPVWITVGSVLVMLVIPGFTQLFALLGLFDIAFPLRSRLNKS